MQVAKHAIIYSAVLYIVDKYTNMSYTCYLRTTAIEVLDLTVIWKMNVGLLVITQ